VPVGTWRIGRRELDELLGRSASPRAMAVLGNIQRTRNMLLLRGLLELAEADQRARKAHLSENFTALSRIESLGSPHFANLLAHPHVAAWLAMSLKHLSSRGEAMASRPVWADLGYLGSVALAAAIRSSADAQVRVPSYRGRVIVPTFGRINIGDVGDTSAWQMVTLRHYSDGTLTGAHGKKIIDPARSSDSSHLIERVRHLTASRDGLALTLEFDDLDTYRDCHMLGASGRVPEKEVDEWSRALSDGWAILVSRHRDTAELIASHLQTLVPLSPRGRSGLSATSHHAPGAVMLTRPPDAVAFASTLVHELHHTKLCLAMELAPLSDPWSGRSFYSPWRDDPRPLIGVLHGLYAGTGVADFWRVEYQYSGDLVAAFEFARSRQQVESAAATLSSVDSSINGAIVAAVRKRAVSSREVQVPPAEAILAEDVTLDHAVRWRLRNLTLAERDVDLVAAAWRAGRRPIYPQVAEIRSDSAEAFVADARLSAAYAALRKESGGEITARSIGRRPGLSNSDRLLISRDYPAAAASYLAEINAGMGSAEVWAGLAVAAHRLGGSAAPALTKCPELVRGVYGRLAGAVAETRTLSPLEIARWLSVVAQAQDP
jgi:HEXXH motif-containing protein